MRLLTCVDLAQNNRETSELSKSRFSINLSLELMITIHICQNDHYIFKNRNITSRGHQCVDLAQNNRETSELSKSRFSINLSLELMITIHDPSSVCPKMFHPNKKCKSLLCIHCAIHAILVRWLIGFWLKH